MCIIGVLMVTMVVPIVFHNDEAVCIGLRVWMSSISEVGSVVTQQGVLHEFGRLYSIQ
jgi:hypothetical protein